MSSPDFKQVIRAFARDHRVPVATATDSSRWIQRRYWNAIVDWLRAQHDLADIQFIWRSPAAGPRHVDAPVIIGDRALIHAATGGELNR